MNRRGTVENLVPAHPGNTNAVRHGIYSKSGRVLSTRAAEIANAVMESPTVRPIDEFGAVEVGRIVALIEAIDEDLDARGLTSRSGEARSLLKYRMQASRHLQSWLDRYALTPRGRADVLHAVSSGSLGAEIARRRAEADAVDQ
jgi:hypothetical protein